MDILKAIYEAGVIGAGGAGFPTHKKLVQGVETLIVNAAECEPLLNSDQYIMRTYAKELVEALATLKKELNIRRVVIGIKHKYTEEIEALTAAIKKRRAAIELHTMESFYPAGDEQIMIYEITGETVPPGGIPLALDIVVVNVTTLYNIFNALQGRPVIKRCVTVTGAVSMPLVIEVPVGTGISFCIEAAGGPTAADYVLIMGGPMMGRLYGGEEAENLFITKTDGGVILLPREHYLNTFQSQPIGHIVNQAKSACIQCSFCTDMCPRYLIGHRMRPHKVMRAIATGAEPVSLTDALLCCECGICELYACPMGLSPRRVNQHIKAKLREEKLAGDKAVYEEQRSLRPGRSIAQSRLIQRLNLAAYPTHLDRFAALTPDQVTIPLKQGIGKPAEPVVALGAAVAAGDVIAKVAPGDMGSMVHASISGTVTRIESAITIEKGGL